MRVRIISDNQQILRDKILVNIEAPMFQFELETALFKFTVDVSTRKPLLQLPPTIAVFVGSDKIPQENLF